MRRFLTALTISAMASVLYVTSAPGAQQAGTVRARQFVALQKQVRSVQKQVRSLRERTARLKSEVVWTLEMLETAMRDSETCFAALTADEFQNTWSQIDRVRVSVGGHPTFGIQSAVDDRNACQGLGLQRPPLNSMATPTVAPFKGFIGWFNGG
jgi:hypothetical protein